MVTRLLLLVSGVLALGVCPSRAQSTLTGPTLGLFFDPQAGGIRPILGIPGSATAGQPMSLGFPVSAGLISPLQDYALVVSGQAASTMGSSIPSSSPAPKSKRRPSPGKAKWMSVVAFASSVSSVQQIRGIVGTPDRSVTSPAGKFAALYHRSSGSADIITGLPGSPQLARRVDLSALPGTPEAISISDDGSLLLVGVRENAGGSPAQGEVFLFTADSAAARSIATVQHVSAITFVGPSHDALLADDAANCITLLSDVANGAKVAWAFSDQQFPAPDSVQASPDGQRFVAGSSAHNAIAILDASGSNAVFVTCGCAPTELKPLNVSWMYQITEPANGLFWVLDGRSSSPNVFFVPIPNTSSQASLAANTTEADGVQ